MKRPLLVLALLLCAPFLCGFDLFRSSNSKVEQGNKQLKAGKFKEALESYTKAAKELPDEPGVFYNLGIAHFQLGQFKEAREAMLKATGGGTGTLKYKSFYNLGNSLFEQKQYKEAVSAYVRALQLNPQHKASKWNLELALRMLKEEEKKKKEQEKKDQEKNKDKKKDQQDKQDKNEQDGKGDEKNQQKEEDKAQKQQDKSEKKDKKQHNPQQHAKDQPKPKPSQQQMNNVLDTLDRNDKNLQRQRAKSMMSGGFRRPTKDW